MTQLIAVLLQISGPALMFMIARRMLKDQSGATAIEYGLLIGQIGMALVFSLGTVANELGDLYKLIDGKTANAAKKL